VGYADPYSSFFSNLFKEGDLPNVDPWGRLDKGIQY